MENKEITKQMIDCHKAAFETGFNSMVMLQEQTSKVLDNFIRQVPWIPGQTKSIINEWSSMYKKGVMDFKAASDQNYSKLEEVLTAGLESFQTKSKN